jgi:hypothetical protein
MPPLWKDWPNYRQTRLYTMPQYYESVYIQAEPSDVNWRDIDS